VTAAKKKRKRNIKPVADVLRTLKTALGDVEAVSSVIESAKYGLDEITDEVNEASDKLDEAIAEVDGIAEVIRERIERLQHKPRTRRKKKG